MNFYPKDGQFRSQRKMYQGNWKCSKCGADIHELPFEPDPARFSSLLCRNCHRERVKRFRRN